MPGANRRAGGRSAAEGAAVAAAVPLLLGETFEGPESKSNLVLEKSASGSWFNKTDRGLFKDDNGAFEVREEGLRG